METTAQKHPCAIPAYGILSLAVAGATFFGNLPVMSALGQSKPGFILVLGLPVIALLLGIVGLCKRQYRTAVAAIALSVLSLYLPGWSECFVSYANGPPEHCARIAAGEARWHVLLNKQ